MDFRDSDNVIINLCNELDEFKKSIEDLVFNK